MIGLGIASVAPKGVIACVIVLLEGLISLKQGYVISHISTTSAPRKPHPKIGEGESNDLVLQDTLQVSLAEQKSHEELETKQNVEKVKKHLMAKEIEKLVEGSKNVEENVEVASSPLRNDDNQTDPSTRLEPRSDKESPEVEKIDDISQPVNVIEEEEESAEDDYEFMPRRNCNELSQYLQDIMMESLPKLVDERIKKILQTQVSLHVAQGLILKREKSQAEVDKMIAYAIQQECKNFLSKISLQVNDVITNHIPSQDGLLIWLDLKYKFERLHMASTPCIPSVVRPKDQDDPHDDAHLEGENSPSTSGNQEQSNDFDFWTNSYAIDDDVLPNEKFSQELVDEILQTVDEAKLCKVVDEMLRQHCPLGDEHQYHINQKQNFLKSDIIPHAETFYIKKQQEPRKPTEEIYLNSKIVQIIKTYWELGQEHKFIIKIVARRANGSIVSIFEPDYKNLNKNDIEDMYLLIVNHKVDDYAETRFLWSLSVFIRILQGLKRYNNDVKYGYVTSSLSNQDAEYLQLFAEEIKEQFKHQDQMRRYKIQTIRAYNDSLGFHNWYQSLVARDLGSTSVYGHHVAAGGYDVDDWLSLWCSSSLYGMHETLIHFEDSTARYTFVLPGLNDSTAALEF
ncbi:hypothetical protein Tco_1203532 [Tanacetum coccineum]